MTKAQLLSIFLTLFSDQVIFPLLQLCVVAVFIYAVVKENPKSGLILKRGEKSWNYLHLSYGVALLILIEIIGSTDTLTGYKTFISIINIVMLTYLTFFNSWFRNKIMGFIVKSQNKKERF